MNYIGIPGIMVTSTSGEKIKDMHDTAFASIESRPGMSAHWQELEMASWPDKDTAFEAMYHQLTKRNEGSDERIEWLSSIRNLRYGKKSPSSSEL
jgi:hypothetical protein